MELERATGTATPPSAAAAALAAAASLSRFEALFYEALKIDIIGGEAMAPSFARSLAYKLANRRPAWRRLEAVALIRDAAAQNRAKAERAEQQKSAKSTSRSREFAYI